MIGLKRIRSWGNGRWRLSPEQRPAALLAVLLVAVTMLIAIGIGSPMLLDDLDELQHVRSFHSIADALVRPDCYGLFRPVKNVIFFAVAHSGRLASAVRHGMAWSTYVLACFLFVAYANRLLKNRAWAVVCALVWALAPTQVSSLAWFSCINILWMAVFVLTGMLLYDTGIDRGGFRRARARAPMVLAGTCFFLAVLSYEAAIAFPALLVLHDAVKGRRPGGKQVVRYGAFGLVALATIAIRLAGNGRMRMGSEGFGPITAAQTVFASGYFMLDHLALWLAPMGRQEILGTFVWGQSAPVYALGIAYLVVIGLAVVLVMLWKKAPLISFGMLWFFIAFLPMSNLVPLKNGPFADYYLVLPGMGLAIALVAAARQILRIYHQAAPGNRLRRVAGAALALLLVWRIAATATSFGWAGAWRHPSDLFRRSVEAGPYAFRTRANLARIYSLAGYPDTARALARQSIAEAPWYALSYNVLGDTETRQGAYRVACTNYVQATAADPRAPYPYFALGYVYETHLNDPTNAAAWYTQVLALPWNPYSETSALNLSRLYALDGHVEEAIRVLKDALKFAPTSASLHHNLSLARGQLGRTDAADRPDGSSP